MAAQNKHSHAQGARTRGQTNRSGLRSQWSNIARFERRIVRKSNRKVNKEVILALIEGLDADDAIFAVDVWPYS